MMDCTWCKHTKDDDRECKKGLRHWWWVIKDVGEYKNQKCKVYRWKCAQFEEDLIDLWTEE
jgi:hypothetical protein